MVVPDDLQYYPLSGRFIKKSALQQRGFRITKKTAYKDYVAAFAMANTKNVKAYAGLDLVDRLLEAVFLASFSKYIPFRTKWVPPAVLVLLIARMWLPR